MAAAFLQALRTFGAQTLEEPHENRHCFPLFGGPRGLEVLARVAVESQPPGPAALIELLSVKVRIRDAFLTGVTFRAEVPR
jgi:hypothetical protein